MTDKERTNLQYYASLLLSDAELDQIMEFPKGTVRMGVLSGEGDIAKAVNTGRLMTKCELHESTLTTARRHSTPAQQMAMDMLKKLELQ